MPLPSSHSCFQYYDVIMMSSFIITTSQAITITYINHNSSLHIIITCSLSNIILFHISNAHFLVAILYQTKVSMHPGILLPPTRPPTDVTIFQRWRNHILLTLLVETSEAIRLGFSAITPALITRWFIVVFGILLGGNGVYLLHWISKKLMEHYPMLSCVLAFILVVCGPTISPIPLTPLTACDSLVKRITLTIGYVSICYGLPKLHLDGTILEAGSGISTLSSHQILCIMSGLWHMDRGDYNFRWVRNDSHTLIDSARSTRSDEMGGQSQSHDHDHVDLSAVISDELLQCMSHYLLLFHFQATAGIGICWAAFEVYSNTVFFWGMAAYAGVHCCLYYVFKSRH